MENQFLQSSTPIIIKMFLKRLFFAGSALIVSGSLAAQTVANDSVSLVLSLDECLRIALDESPTIKIADMEVTRTDYSRKETLGQLLPTVSFGANYNRMLAKQVMYMNMDGFGGGSASGGDNSGEGGDGSSETPASSGRAAAGGGGIKVGLDNSYSTGFTASMPLIAPQLWQSLKLSDANILRNVELARQSRLDLINQVKTAYYAYLLAKDSRRVIQESYDMAKLNYDIYSKKYTAGAASDYDVLRTSVAMKNIEPQLMQADIAIKQARLQLLILMGLDASFKIEVPSGLSDYEDTMYQTVLDINPDYSGNSSLKLNSIDADITRRTVKLQQFAWLPTLAISANYNWTSMSNGSPLRNFRWNPYSQVGLTLSVPLFEGGQKYSRVKQAKIQAAEITLQRENLERSISNQVSLAIDNINVNVKQIASCSESVKEAERAHDIMERSFAIGAASYLDLRDSELALTQARLSRYQAIYNFLVANSELELLLGSADIDSLQSANKQATTSHK